MVCENCGTEVKEGSTFCPRCGKTINSSDGVLPNGEVKNEEFDGQGVRYELDGSVWQKGKFRDGYCVSEE